MMSFHKDYNRWKQFLAIEGCPICQNWPKPESEVLIKEFPTSWLIATPLVSCLFGQCCIVAKPHAVELYDLNENDLLNYMKEVQISARALMMVTNAVKINYEIHGNTIPHLHMHLYPRHINDKFAGVPINPYKVDACIYNDDEFEKFIEKMKKLLVSEEGKPNAGRISSLLI